MAHFVWVFSFWYNRLKRTLKTKEMGRKIGVCPKCKQEKNLTRHHVYPKVHFFIDEIEYICRDCHDDLEYFIIMLEGLTVKGKRRKLKASLYPMIYQIFINK